MEETKTCTRCREIKLLGCFNRDRTRKLGRRPECAVCSSKGRARRRKSQPTALTRKQDRSCSLRKHYGLTIEAYDEMLHRQGGVCAICRQPERMRRKTGELFRLAVDHAHETGLVRGLLCKDCNIAVGSFRDRPSLMTRAATYVYEAKEKETNEATKMPID